MKFVFTVYYHEIPSFEAWAFSLFEQDQSMIEVFAFSTFPAFFGFFQIDYYCERASNFIKHAINTHLETLSEKLIESFFLCQFMFFRNLWSDTYQTVSKLDNLDDVFIVFCTILQKNLPSLSPFHFSILQDLNQTDPSKFVKILFKCILLPSMEYWRKHGFFSNEDKKYMIIKDQLSKVSLTGSSVSTMISLIFSKVNLASSDSFLISIHQLLDFQLFHFVFSHADLSLLVLIAENGDRKKFQEIEKLIQYRKETDFSSFQPFFIQLSNPVSESSKLIPIPIIPELKSIIFFCDYKHVSLNSLLQSPHIFLKALPDYSFLSEEHLIEGYSYLIKKSQSKIRNLKKY
jgi:hypothetical protein